MDKNINLQSNGKFFPSWVLLNFSKYKLDKIMYKDDPCKQTDIKNELRKYQEFISSFLDYKSPFKDILLYHGLGSGKTATVINLMNILYNYTTNWNYFIIIKASLKDNWLEEISNWMSKDEFDTRFKNIKFINYDSPFADKQFLESIKNSDNSYNSLYIIDEAHNFINNVYNNIVSKIGKKAYIIYDYILQEKLNRSDTRVVLLSGTPAINNPFELSLIFNLLRPNIFPNSELKFNEYYIKSNKLSSDKINMFQRRIMGLVSYYSGADYRLFAKKNIKIIEINMDIYQEQVYRHFEIIEEKIKSKSVNNTYKSFTRQSCNFVFPIINDKINGENRPRPSQFNLDNDKMYDIDYDKNDTNIIKYMKLNEHFVNSFYDYLNNININDQKKKLTLKDDIYNFENKFNYNFKEFWKNSNKSNLLNELYKCSSKIVNLIFNTFNSKGPLIIFSNYVKMEGIEIIKLYLKFFGFKNFNDQSSKDNYRYTEYLGNIDMETREKNRKIFNKKDNMYGKIIKIIFISPAGSEGISLKNIRQVHVLEPFWNEVRITQLIGRAVRQCSHADLPIEDRIVYIFRYISTRKNNNETTDQEIFNLSNKKQILIDSFLNIIKEVAVDCELFKNHNIQNNEYRCFKFNDNSLFDDVIGPAYKKDIDYDIYLDNGLNSNNSKIVKINVIETYVVKKISENKFSDKIKCLLNLENGNVYDFDLQYPIGKIKFDDDKLPELYSNNIYILSHIINIPVLKNNQL